MDLSEFLLARIAEDEEAARTTAGWDRSGRQRATGRWQRYGISSVDDDEGLSVIYDDAGRVSGDVAEHIARWDPARALAECQAKRRIVEHADDVSGMDSQIESEWGTRGSVPWEEDEGIKLLRFLTLPYSDHPDYQPEWAVQ